MMASAPRQTATWAEWLGSVAKLLHLRDKAGLTSCPKFNQDFDYLGKIFTAAKRWTEARGGELILVYLPGQWSCSFFRIGDRRVNWFYDGALKAMEHSGAKIIDLKNQPIEVWYPGSHFSQRGYEQLVGHLQRFGR